MFDLSGKTAVVTGAGSGIGQAIALTYAQEGALVFGLEFDQNKALHTLKLIQERGGKAQALTCDVSDPSSVKAAMDEIAQVSPQIDILVNNAGISHIGSLEDTSEEDFDRVYQVNVKGVYLCMQAAVPYMKAKGGSIINLASIASFVGLADRFAYSMSKGAVWLMTLTAAKDLIRYNIRVNAISPARVHTPFVDQYLANNYPGQEAEMFQKLSSTQPIGRMGKPKEVAALALYLASDEASFATGSNFPLDGGFVNLNT
ncbi:MAG: glucose 1-dehydrogenase [Bacteroidota bacterium]